MQEWLALKLLEEQQEGYDKTEMQILEATRKNIDTNKGELASVGNVDSVGNIETVEDGETVNPYFYVTVDKDVYKVDIKGAGLKGMDNSTPTTNPTAEEVSYTPNDSSWKVDNVKSALDYFLSK